MAANSQARILPAFTAVGMIALGFILGGCAGSPEPHFSSHHARFHRGQPNYRAEPYQVKGVWYTPKVDYAYDESGTASWYGPGFHEQYTADGEVYDMNGLSAAHKTLPLPSVVRVTNLQNGRELRLRVNDRGPFVDGRLIDVSRRAAQLLGFEGSGTAPVRVKILKEESIQVAEAAMRGEFGPVGIAGATAVARNEPVVPAPVESRSAERRPVTLVASAGPPSLRAAEVVGAPPPAGPQSFATPPAPPPLAISAEPAPRYNAVAASASGRSWPSLIASAHADTLHPPQIASSSAPALRPTVRNTGRIFVQAGAFAVPENAQRVRARIASLGSVEIVPASGNRGLYLVRVGPVASDAAAARLLSRVVDSGYPGARVVSE